jgi:iron(III) transport system permease protein
MIIAFLAVRKKFIGKSFMEFTSLFAMAVPGTVLGLGYISAYNSKPLLLTGTGFIIVAAFVVRSLPVGVRSGVAALQQIDPALEEAAQDMGANSAKVFTSVTLPLIKPAFFNGLVYTFVRSMTAVSAVVFLITPKYQLLTVSILSQVESGRFGVCAAYSTILMAVVFGTILLMNLALNKMGVSKSDDSIL